MDKTTRRKREPYAMRVAAKACLFRCDRSRFVAGLATFRIPRLALGAMARNMYRALGVRAWRNR